VVEGELSVDSPADGEKGLESLPEREGHDRI
jgi:hypothetical protein